MKEKFFLGIDPGRNTGIAIYQVSKKRLVKLMLLDFWGTIKLLDTFEKVIKEELAKETVLPGELDFETDLEIVIEDPQLNEPAFVRPGTTERMMRKIAQDVGRNKENAFLFMEYMNKRRIRFRQVQPKTRKWDAEEMKKFTGWQGSSNEHNRDAAKLVFGLKY